jgi:Txe/YoeB family toxin of Txe-Axe toxin-antitoxin module
MARAGAGHEPWLIHFFQRHSDEDASTPVPAIEFLASLPPNTAAEFHAILNAVAKAPPPAFSGGGKWEAMHGDMAGIYEARVSSRGANHRLFCLLVRTSERLSGPSIVCLGGLTKPVRSPAQPRDYALIRQYAAEFRKHGTVLR